jgi:hypothetical protein
LRTGVYYQFHGIVFTGKNFHGLGKGILNTAIPVGSAQRAGAVPPGINFNLHSVKITKTRDFRHPFYFFNRESFIKIIFFCYNRGMPFVRDLLMKLKNLGAVLTRFLTGLRGKISGLLTRRGEGGSALSALKLSFQKAGSRVLKLPGTDKKKFALVGLGVLFAVLLFSLAAVLIAGNQNAGSRAGEGLSGGSPGSRIPAEELFLPEEPDFLPGVLLEREPRRSWTAEDGEPYWRDPLKNGEEPWRDTVESVIDELLERVP